MPTRPLPLQALLSSSVLAAAVGLGCTSSSLARDSAEPTQCAAEAIEISDARQPLDGPSSWTATCGETKQAWFCSRIHQRVICTEDPSP
ncbi:hypothetical protein G6O69_25525 [Pseudenhygromyxa sp. WMMC2535]|uniref:hypothetical protein n=1 Tax=Pseudenhygromyxa sp. WMMC2535 TaxID=2712867 RepID=UPI0015552FC7|nr:hypothetical protein [Pseudenhygromyxa sp. WMMC2535]NVB41225.1 hypothetical protein [Pseudenhygromyxa sp. WMMC2535]